MSNNTSIQSPLKKARGLGSSHYGTEHKLKHSITTLLNIPVVAWLMYTVFSLRDADYAEFTAVMAHPVNIIFGIALVVITLKHFALELQVVYEDYISCKCLRMIKVIGMKILFLVLGSAVIVSILKIAFMAPIS